MQIINQTLENFTISYPLETLAPLERILFIDIETTGFTARSSSLYLIGTAYYQTGCWHIRQWFAENNTDAVATFLKEYGASIEGMTADIEGTAAKIEANGIFTKAAVAAKAIPNCNVCFITGSEMQTALSEFLNIMFEVAPASVGGSIPGDDFYCILG